MGYVRGGPEATQESRPECAALAPPFRLTQGVEGAQAVRAECGRGGLLWIKEGGLLAQHNLAALHKPGGEHAAPLARHGPDLQHASVVCGKSKIRKCRFLGSSDKFWLGLRAQHAENKLKDTI